MLPGQSDKNKKTFYKIKKRNSRDGQLFLFDLLSGLFYSETFANWLLYKVW